MLATAHGAGIAHRDLKPGNSFLASHGPKLLDFGLARLHAVEPPMNASTFTGMATGEVSESLTGVGPFPGRSTTCLLYTSDAADE